MAKVRGFFYMSNYFEDNFRIIFRLVLEVLNNQCVFKTENFFYFFFSLFAENQRIIILFGKL